MDRQRIEAPDFKTPFDIQYVYRHAVVGGRDVWKWQQKGTFVWATAKTEHEAIDQMKEDATKRGSSASIRDISLFRPRPEESLERSGTSQRVKEPAKRRGVNTARTAVTDAMSTSARTVEADIRSGVYRGTIVSETEQHILQRQSAQTAVLHPKQLLDRSPETGEIVRITYSNSSGLVQQTHSRAKAPEMGP